MKDGNEIEIYYRWCKLDKVHEYGVVCREQPQRHGSTNSWIYWIWFKMGASLLQSLRKNEKQKFRLLPYANTWDEKSKLIKEYKTVNNGTDRVVPAILRHFQKVKHKK